MVRYKSLFNIKLLSLQILSFKNIRIKISQLHESNVYGFLPKTLSMIHCPRENCQIE